MTAPAVEVIVCTYTPRRRATLHDGIQRALCELPPAGLVTIVVDGDGDYAAELTAHFRAEPRVAVVSNRRARGLSGARNTAATDSTRDVLLFVDDDAALRSGWHAALQRRFADPAVVAVGGAVHPRWESGDPPWFPPEFGWVVGCDYRGLPVDGAALRNPIGACMAIRRGVFERIGLFAEGIGRIGTHPVGGEETDLGIRLGAAGPPHTVIRDTALAVDHLVPRERARMRYLVRRCFWEGRSKALLAARADGSGVLSPERGHVFSTLRRAVATDAVAAARGQGVAMARNLARVAGVLAAGLGYLSCPAVHRRRAVLAGTPRRQAPEVSVVVATLGRSPDLADTTRAVLGQTGCRLEVIVVDNDPRSGRVRRALAGVADERLRIVAEPRRGLSAARNRGIAAASGALVAFTDDDARPAPGWLAALAAGFDDPRVVCVTGRVRPASVAADPERWFEQAIGFDKGDRRHEWGRDELSPGWEPGPRGPVYPIAAGEFGSGNNMAFRRRFLVERGGFATALGAGSPTRGGEDLDMFRRVVLAGGVLRYEPAAEVAHRHRETVAALRTQLFGYGTGMAANVTRFAMTSPRAAIIALRALPTGLRMLLNEDSEKNDTRPDDYPRSLVRAERRGYAVGPFLYLLAAAREAVRGSALWAGRR
ncbi:glycosyltransferase [Microbacterium sp.]|uniref:glycosyltransferase n=1 Tax=Microbacterium sp. TaxID=51671 RepID=UPI003A8707AE